MGMVAMVVLTAVQNTVPGEDIGAAGSVVTVARSIGAAFGVAVFGTLRTSGFTSRLHQLRPPAAFDPSRPETIRTPPAPVRPGALDALAHAMGGGVWITPPVVAGTVLARFLRPGRDAPS
ncbi:hypothetical protein [Streptomyces fagopyri]|uniref:hypothetical protein n=1 Tax=Streptomyces fagopyri TaxID=2662397 RepID=UPI0037168C93